MNAKPSRSATDPSAAATAAIPHRNDDLRLRSVMYTSSADGPNPQVMEYLVLGLLRHADRHGPTALSLSRLGHAWERMHLAPESLQEAIRSLRRKGYLKPPVQPDTHVALTRAGFGINHARPQDMQDGIDRWEATRRLRATRSLGALPESPQPSSNKVTGPSLTS